MSCSKRDISNYSKSLAFSLLELIVVILLVAIISISLGNLASNSVFGYIDAKDRNRMSQSSRWIIERLTREIRESLPQSIRTDISGSFYCLEFLPIVNASHYLDLPESGLIDRFSAVNYDLTTINANFLAIMPTNTQDIYSNNGVLGSISSISLSTINPNTVDINLASPTIFNQRSPQNRFYLLSLPVSFCLDSTSGIISRYSNYGLSAIQQLPPNNGTPIANDFLPLNNVFDYQAGTLSRSGLLQISLIAKNLNRVTTNTEESFEIFHEVHIRNVP